MKRSKIISVAILGIVLFSGCKEYKENQINENPNDYLYMDTEEFRVFINNNDKTGTQWLGYNGIKSLIPYKTGNNIIVPYFAGLNFETINLTGLEPYPEVFEPRREPMLINKISDTKIELIIPETGHSHVSGKITFTVEEPCYIHQSIELTFNKLFASEREKNEFNALFASYINVPILQNLFMRLNGVSGNPLEGWFSVTKESHHSKEFLINYLPSNEKLSVDDYVSILKDNKGEADNDNEQFQSKSIGEPNAIKTMGDSLSFYFGHLYDGLIYLQMFKQPKMFRLAFSPTGGGTGDRGDGTGPVGNPAWDYVLYLDDVKQGETYKWDCCLAVKSYKGREDIIDEVIRYQNK